MMESRAGLGILAIVLLAMAFILMFRFLRFWAHARQEHRLEGGSWLLATLAVGPGDHGKKGQAATRALWNLIGLTFVLPAAATTIEKGATLFGKPVRLPSGQPMPPIFLELCSVMFATTALFACLGFALLAAGRFALARQHALPLVTRDLRWSGLALLFAIVQFGWMILLRRLIW